MVCVPFFMWTAIIVVIALLATPNNVIVISSLRFLAENNPITLIKNLIQTSSFQVPTNSQRNTIVKSNYPTASDAVFGDQKPVWKPAESDDDYNNDYSSGDDEQFDSGPTMDAHSFPYLEYLQTMLESVRFLAFNAWHDPRIFIQPEASLVPKEDESATKTEESERLAKICEVLLLSGIEYSACDSLVIPIAENVMEIVTSPWTEADEHGIRWKEIKEGKDQGCLYFLKASAVPLKMSTSPNEDGSTKLSYYTKNTIGKYCPDGENDEEAKRFFEDLSDEVKPSKISTFLNTRLFYNYTVFDMLEFHLLMDACLIALYRHFNHNGLGQPTSRSLLGFIVTYSFCYFIYFWIFK